jgi:hypothetical protein
MPSAEIRRQRGLRLATAAFIAASVVGGLGLLAFLVTRIETNKSAPTSSVLPSSAPQTTTSAAVSRAEIVAAEVRVSMQQKLDKDPDLKRLRLKVVDVALVNKSGNEFKGIATIKARDGVEHQVPVEVTADGDNTLWETPPGAFDFPEDSTPQPQAPPPSRSAPGPSEEFTVCPSGFSGVASADTSCAFADSVRRSWYSSPGNIIAAYSPVTHQTYMMECTPAATTVWPAAKRCVGVNTSGAVLIVYIA